MDYPRFLGRNGLTYGDYDPGDEKGVLRGDLRRLERDELSDERVAYYRRVSGADKAEVERLLRAFLGLPEPACAECEREVANRQTGQRRCHFHAYQLGRWP